MRSAGIEEVNLKDKRENDGNKHPACDKTNKLTNTLKRKPQVENEALEKRTVVIDQPLTSGGTEQLPEGDDKFPGNLQNTTESAVEDAVALSPPSEGEENRKRREEKRREEKRREEK